MNDSLFETKELSSPRLALRSLAVDRSRDRAASHLSSHSRDDRRASGLVYTPQPIVDFVLDLSRYSGVVSKGGTALLDPSCGSGFFLQTTANRIADVLVDSGVSLRTTSGRKRFVAAVERNLFGVDVDPVACEIARAAVREAVQERLQSTALPRSFFTANVLCADFLLAPEVARLAGGRFRYIVGNPPYVSTTRLSAEYKARLRDAFDSASGRIDLYTLFMERALTLLQEGGTLGFITPNKFLLSRSAMPFRQLALRQARLRTIANFSSHKVFDDAATVPCVTVLDRARRRTPVVWMECDYVRTDGQDRVEIHKRTTVSSKMLDEDSWHMIADENLRRIADAIRGERPTLSACVDRLSAGIATGRDGVFVVPDDIARELESELLHPAVRGRDVTRFTVRDSGHQMLLPYRFGEGKPVLVDIADYPKARAYLQRFRETLEARHCVRAWGKAWYDVHDPVSFNIADAAKVLVPDVADRNRFAISPDNAVPVHAVYYLVPRGRTPEVLTAILNSSLIEFLIMLEAPIVKDGFRRYRKQFLESLPLPAVSLRTSRRLEKAAADGDIPAIDDICARVWQLSKQDLKAVQAFVQSGRSAVTPG